MPPAASRSLVCGRPIEDCLRLVEAFHGFRAPGLVLGIFMVDRAQALVGPGRETDVIAESRHCLPDAVQLFTPCTIGNGWLKIRDWDKFALTFYDRRDRRGYRVWLDLRKAGAFPNLINWYMRRVSKKDLPLDVLLETILTAGSAVLSSAPVTLTHFYDRVKKGRIAVCPLCGEAYGADQGRSCAQCRGEGYWIPDAADDGRVAAGR